MRDCHINLLFFFFFKVGCQGTEQHSQGHQRHSIFQPRPQGRLTNHHGVDEGLVHQEQLPLSQGQDAEGGDHQTHVQRRGRTFCILIHQAHPHTASSDHYTQTWCPYVPGHFSNFSAGRVWVGLGDHWRLLFRWSTRPTYIRPVVITKSTSGLRTSVHFQF